jgi:hypothetical protein
MKCASCDKTIRRGTGRRALVLSRANKPTLSIVCTRCHASAVPVVVPPPTTIAPPCAGCGRHPARYCEDCHRNVCTNVKHLSGANAGWRARQGAAS